MVAIHKHKFKKQKTVSLISKNGEPTFISTNATYCTYIYTCIGDIQAVAINMKIKIIRIAKIVA